MYWISRHYTTGPVEASVLLVGLATAFIRPYYMNDIPGINFTSIK